MRRFDGLICFGGSDWWYHNRGHYDLQMCRQLARRVPVLYVNSLGVRVPRLAEGSQFFRRVSRKIRSWRRNFVQVDEWFGVVSPISVPGPIGRSLCRPPSMSCGPTDRPSANPGPRRDWSAPWAYTAPEKRTDSISQ